MADQVRTAFAGVFVALLCTITACTADSDPVSTARTTSGPLAVCPSDPGLGESVLEGRGQGATLWAMFFASGGRLTTGQENKVVWRMTGSGDITIVAAGPDGTTVQPTWLKQHGGSTFDRPGDEIGTGWKFPAAGCWTFRATRAVGSGELAVRVSVP